jgi:hypothetical protein
LLMMAIMSGMPAAYTKVEAHAVRR